LADPGDLRVCHLRSQQPDRSRHLHHLRRHSDHAPVLHPAVRVWRRRGRFPVPARRVGLIDRQLDHRPTRVELVVAGGCRVARLSGDLHLLRDARGAARRARL
jgi:hypothetical protein